MERGNQTWWRWFAVIGSVAFLAVFMGAKDTAPSKLKVTELEVVDENGKARVVVGKVNEGDQEFFGARFLNADGELVVAIDDRGQILVRNEKKKLATLVLPRGVSKVNFDDPFAIPKAPIK
jgi:hypothetical protein